ncbi:hypothetical protein AGMMS49992_09830 [Clostridia bacterium]|nr:hypothetical protein AGMMS49992_09830 [Clostridia bacterium]
MPNESASTNREYKSSVFASYFSESKERLIEVYNALSKTQYPPDTPVEINTLDDALFHGRINDVSFLLNNVLVVLIEHQSTWNPNMPFRILLYIARVLERMYPDMRPYYSSSLKKIANVQCFVFYNGREDRPDVTKLRLSDAFEAVPGEMEDSELSNQLELIVPVFNINAGKNHDLLSKSKSLNDYVVFIGKMHELLASGMDRTKITKAAIDYCVKQGIMVDYLKKHATEVLGVLFHEFNLEEYGEVRFEDGWEAGREAERVDQRRKSILNAISMGCDDAFIAKLVDARIEEVREMRQELLMAAR